MNTIVDGVSYICEMPLRFRMCRFFILILPSLVVISGCQPKIKQEKKVVVHLLNDPDMLNPVTFRTSDASEIMANVFQKLLCVDFKNLQLVGVLAESRPEIKTDSIGMQITYQIRKEATWDNGTAVTAKDVEFTFKAIKNPLVNTVFRPYMDFITHIQLYDDPRKITFHSNTIYIRAEYTTGAEINILPKYHYDSNGWMDQFSITDLNKYSDSLKTHPNIVAFANEFNTEKWQRDSGFVIGSGAYAFHQWKTDQRITLEKKKNWWGSSLITESNYFEAYPDKIVYQVINDQTSAITALKGGNIDVMQGIKPKDYMELKANKKFQERYTIYSAPLLIYSYIGINTKLPKFQDKRTRKALAHLVDIDRVIETINYGLGERTVANIHPSNSQFYNHQLTLIDFNPKKAKELLKDAGWMDSDGNGVLDKNIDGEIVDLEIEFAYNTGNDQRKALALIFQEDARKAGIKVNVVAQERALYGQNQRQGNFELYYGAWRLELAPQDPNQLWHTSQISGGMNYCGFGNQATDTLLDSIAITINEEARQKLWFRLQAIIQEESPYIFLNAPMNLIAVNKKFSNTYSSAMNPGYWEAGFKLNE